MNYNLGDSDFLKEIQREIGKKLCPLASYLDYTNTVINKPGRILGILWTKDPIPFIGRNHKHDGICGKLTEPHWLNTLLCDRGFIQPYGEQDGFLLCDMHPLADHYYYQEKSNDSFLPNHKTPLYTVIIFYNARLYYGLKKQAELSHRLWTTYPEIANMFEMRWHVNKKHLQEEAMVYIEQYHKNWLSL